MGLGSVQRKPGEAGEPAIEGDEGGIVLDREGGQVGVADGGPVNPGSSE